MTDEQLKSVRAKLEQGEFSKTAWAVPAAGTTDNLLQRHTANSGSAGLREVLLKSLAALGIGGVAGYAATRPSPDIEQLGSYDRLREIRIPAKKEQQTQKLAFGILGNTEATTMQGVPGYVAGSYLAPALAAYLGWKGMSGINLKNQDLERKKRLSDAQTEYDTALSNLMGGAAPAAEKTADEQLEHIYATVKAASAYNPLDWVMTPDQQGNLLGHYLTYSALAAPLGYLFVDRAMQGSNKNKLLNKAIAERETRHDRVQPAVLRAVLDPVKQEVTRESDKSVA
jgi:hypothetical protein